MGLAQWRFLGVPSPGRPPDFGVPVAEGVPARRTEVWYYAAVSSSAVAFSRASVRYRA
jgi:hypothetical protein